MPTDQALLEAARAGDASAFAALYRTHVDMARREACRRSSRRSYHDDAVAMAFASVFRAITNGAGPDRDFGAYLKTAVRNAVITLAVGPGENWSELDDLELADDSPAAAETQAVSAMMSAALLTLNNRQRRALWATEVEGCSSTDVARELDLTENAFAALKMRARKRLSAAYACQVAGDADTCEWVATRIDDAAAGALGYSHRLVVDMHLEDCEACATLVPERDRSRRGVLALPLLLCAPRCGSRLREMTGVAGANAMSATRRAVMLVGAAGLAGGTLLLSTHGADPDASSARATSDSRPSVLGEPAQATAGEHDPSSMVPDPAEGDGPGVAFPEPTRDDDSDPTAPSGTHRRDDRYGARSPADGPTAPEGPTLGPVDPGQAAAPQPPSTSGSGATASATTVAGGSGHGLVDTSPTTTSPSVVALTTPAATTPATTTTPTTTVPATTATPTTTTPATTTTIATTTTTVAVWVGVVVVPTTSIAPWIGGAPTAPTTAAPFSISITSSTTTSSP